MELGPLIEIVGGSAPIAIGSAVLGQLGGYVVRHLSAERELRHAETRHRQRLELIERLTLRDQNLIIAAGAGEHTTPGERLKQFQFVAERALQLDPPEPAPTAWDEARRTMRPALGLVFCLAIVAAGLFTANDLARTMVPVLGGYLLPFWFGAREQEKAARQAGGRAS